MLGVEPGAGVGARVGDHDRHQGRDGGGLEKNLNYTIYNIAGPKAQNSRDIAISSSFPHLAQSSAFPQSSEALSVIESNASVSGRGLLHLLSPRNLGVLVKTKCQERRLVTLSILTNLISPGISRPLHSWSLASKSHQCRHTERGSGLENGIT